jgi:pimeloyl-ACP methyl ester carboxylesterase
MLHKAVRLAGLAVLGFVATGHAENEQPFVFETWGKQKVEAFRGSFTVPENRRSSSSRVLTLHYVRLPATGTSAGPPIVYLAGGPGASGIDAINYRYALFMEMRNYGNVIALDQRGTGASNDIPRCTSNQTLPTATAISDEKFNEHYRAALRECLAFWKQHGVDIAGYNTLENAQDLEALRKHLGVDKITLWGTSYGGHLALAALKVMPAGLAKAVLSSVRGLDDTLKLPARTDQYLERLQEAIDSQPAAHAAYPAITTLMRRVHARLERQPMLVRLKSRDGGAVQYLLQRRDLQVLASQMFADPRSAAQLLRIYLAVDRGMDPGLDRLPSRWLPDHLSDPGNPISLEGMPVAMDLASGIPEKRRLQVRAQVRTAILGRYFDQLGRYLDNSFALEPSAARLDLGDGFRSQPRSDVPVLLFSGTLDGRTAIESQHEAVSGLGHVTRMTVGNAGHNLFDESSEGMRQAIREFMEGRVLQNRAISVALPNLAPDL